jgi:hypothetical protein
MGKSDKDFAKLLKLMQRQGEANNPRGLEIGVMTSSNTCSIGDLELEADDLLINETLLKPVLTELAFNIIQNSGGTSHTYSWVDKSKYFKPLKKGDMVVLLKLEDQDMYVILCKVVDA